jgi:hypothetical protein
MQTPASNGPETSRLRLLELCSRDLDNDLNEREQAELHALKTEFPGVAERFGSDAARVSGLMRELPVTGVPVQLRKAVRKQLRTGQPVAEPAVRQPLPSPQRRSGRWLVTGVSLSTLAASLAVAVFLRLPAAPDQGARVAELRDAATDSAASAEVFAPLPQADATIEPSEPGIAASEVMLAGDTLQILEIRIDAAKRNSVEKWLADVGLRSGMGIQVDRRTVGSDEFPYDFLYTTAPVEPLGFLGAMVDAGVDGDATWNPARPANMDREELVRKLLQSMKSPTQSELHFGRMYVAVPNPVEPAAPAKSVAALAASEPPRRNSASATESDDDADPPQLVTTSSEGAAAQHAGRSAEKTGAAANSDAKELIVADGSAAAALDLRPDASPSEKTVVAPTGKVPSLQPNQYVLVVLDFTDVPADADCDSGEI